ncbi:MAG: DUF1552 domain-containing protein, partial [Lentisphaeraceae bacterium]|nr:DUF1552 domain-containing protein [Lentisphaeraceae bacterium]
MKLTRKRFLQGAGVAMALPFMESVSTAASPNKQGVPPLRFGTCIVTGGTVHESWVPKKTGKLEKLPSILRNLEGLKNDITIVSGLSNDGGAGKNPHDHCAKALLTAPKDAPKNKAGYKPSESIDHYIAQRLSKDNLFQSLELGANNHETSYSYTNSGTSIPIEQNIRLAFERMFKGRAPKAPVWNRNAAKVAKKVRKTSRQESLEKYIVDLTLEDAKRLQRQVNGSDRQRLGQYIESVYSIERRLKILEERIHEEQKYSSSPTSKEIVMAKPIDDKYAKQIKKFWVSDVDLHQQHFSLFSDLMVVAFQTNVTRVCTLSLGSDDAHFPGVVTVGNETHAHTLEHQGNMRKFDPIARESCRQIHEWYTTLMGQTLHKMRMIDEGGTSLLDNCIMLYTSYMAHGNHSRKNYPIMLAGGGQKSLKKGQHIACKEDTPLANLYIEIANLMGVSCDSFGNSQTSKNARYNGKIPGLV